MYLLKLIKSNRIIDKRLKLISNDNCTISIIKKYFNDHKNIVSSKNYYALVDEYKDSIEAKNRLDDKAKSLLVATSLFSTLLGAYVAIINTIIKFNLCLIFNIFLFGLIFLSLFFIMIAGIFATIIITEKNYVFKYNEKDSKDMIKLKISIIGNRLYNLKRNNYLYCVSLSLKYGFIVSIVSFMLFIIAA